jgi:hypothetical protein
MVSRCAIAAVSLALLACHEGRPPHYALETAGHFEATGGALGPLQLDPRSCVRSLRDQLGVSGYFDLIDRPDGPVFRVVVHKGTLPNEGFELADVVSLGVAVPGMSAGPREVELDTRACRRLEGFVHLSNDSGAIALDCPMPGGGTFVGYATFRGCS